MSIRSNLDRANAEIGYSNFDRERFLVEDRLGGTSRGEFARDRARLLHSSALRRLGAKTQVLSPTVGDFARTRLTHSLEVAQIGREMAIDIGLNADIVDMASLAHDLGHPPFGHNGEKALNDWAIDIGGFEGNAQTLRLLTRLEPKVFTESGRSVGLNLTRASLDATCKYPWALGQALESKDHSVKFGVYEDDMEIFTWMREGAAPRIKCVEAQVMDFADDVAYSVHDFEDAVVSGFVNLEALADGREDAALLDSISEWTFGEFSHDALAAAFARLRLSRYWLNRFTKFPSGTPAELGTLKNLTSELIGRFVSKTTRAIIDSSPVDSPVRYGSRIEVPTEVREEIAVLKGIVSAFLMSHASRQPLYESQRELIIELADALLASNGESLIDSYASTAWALAKTDRDKKRVIVDLVASLTDQSAVILHKELTGTGA